MRVQGGARCATRRDERATQPSGSEERRPSQAQSADGAGSAQDELVDVREYLDNPQLRRIFLVRGRKVMLSPDLAELYHVEPRALVQAVKRNSSRFPADFMFQLTQEEYANLKSQFVISTWGGLTLG